VRVLPGAAVNVERRAGSTCVAVREVKSRQNERGAAVVEFALIAPLLLMMVLGIAEFGRAYNVQANLSQAAREGVRVMALHNDPAGAIAATKAAAPTLTLTNITVTPASCVASGTTPAATATVTVTYSLTFITKLFGTGKTLTGKGFMRCNG
jgi:Flp pilus assembly protein TadG